jgi:hypothetical protein
LRAYAANGAHSLSALSLRSFIEASSAKGATFFFTPAKREADANGETLKVTSGAKVSRKRERGGDGQWDRTRVERRTRRSNGETVQPRDFKSGVQGREGGVKMVNEIELWLRGEPDANGETVQPRNFRSGVQGREGWVRTVNGIELGLRGESDANGETVQPKDFRSGCKEEREGWGR